MSFDTGEEKIGTYQFLDSVGEALGWEAFPYPTTPHEHMPISYIPGQGGSLKMLVLNGLVTQ